MGRFRLTIGFKPQRTSKRHYSQQAIIKFALQRRKARPGNPKSLAIAGFKKNVRQPEKEPQPKGANDKPNYNPGSIIIQLKGESDEACECCHSNSRCAR
jgi:hypothetical protein